VFRARYSVFLLCMALQTLNIYCQYFLSRRYLNPRFLEIVVSKIRCFCPSGLYEWGGGVGFRGLHSAFEDLKVL
jgi:hypothetical protein